MLSARRTLALLAALALAAAPPAIAQDGDDSGDENESKLNQKMFGALSLRGIGPALMSGRIGDIAVHPHDDTIYYVAVASGNVWKTINNGTTFEPIFDDYGSYSIGCVTIDPNNPSVVWVGTGENNSQRSVSFGDGVYKSTDAGKSFTNMGLEDSEHIGMIAVDPRDSDVVYVAAQGPLWNAGGDRGLYKTTDGGETWELILEISEDTGANEVHLDPRDPDTIYCSVYQRRRHIWTLINGGPESGLWKSVDGGDTWYEINKGLPTVDLGRIGLDIAPSNPDLIYAIVEAADDESGFYASTDRGESWERRSDHVSASPQYYQEIVVDPNDQDRIYSLTTFLSLSEDGGRSFRRVPIQNKHVDDHALWIDPTDSSHMINGNDGGIYETWDYGETWQFKPNLPITQFYRVSVDERRPFYFIYGGTQDNNTQGGPSRTTDRAGIVNADWFVTVGGDGYETAVDPTDHNVVYSQWQYGGLVRHDRRSGEILDIKPREKPGDEPYVWNWDTPLIISPHSHTRLYYAADRLFRSDDRGESWRAISPDLTRRIDRNELEVMSRVQPPDAVSKHRSTSIYGNAVSLAESPLVEDLVYVGTDDGLLHVTDDAGQTWRVEDSFPGVPTPCYTTWVRASHHDPDRLYAAWDNKKNGDFTAYMLRSDDRGRTWTDISGDMPDRTICHGIVEDHENPDLLFAGTEFGAYFTIDGGERWIKLSGVPTISVQDLEIQMRESDLVLGTFGRGFYVLDDYSPLRTVSEDLLENADAHLFPIKDALAYIERSRLGGTNGKGSQGASYYTAPNPPFGAVFTYYLKDKIETREEIRKETIKEAEEAGEDWDYPTVPEFRAEDREPDPGVYIVVRDEQGAIVNRVEASREAGLHRVAWNLRYPSSEPIDLGDEELAPWEQPDVGPLVAPGEFTATLVRMKDGAFEELAGPEPFRVVSLGLATFAAADKEAKLDFEMRAGRLQRAVLGARRVADDAAERLQYLHAAVLATPGAENELLTELEGLRQRLEDLRVELRGDPTLARRAKPEGPSISDRVNIVVGGLLRVTNAPTGTQREQYRFAADDFERVLADLRRLVLRDLADLESRLERAGAPWTPGRFPEWSPE